jgi:dihydroflavonol-4-reductase
MAICPPPPPGSRIAVVGGTGFLGAHIVRELAVAGYQPVAVARRPELIHKLWPQVHAETRVADVSDPDSLEAALAGCAAVHSTVALVDQAFTSTRPEVEEQLISTNVQGALDVLRAAHLNGIGRVILAGSCSMRYQANGTVARESSPPTDPALVGDAYVRSKLALGEQAPALADEFGLNLTVTMPGALFGPGDHQPSLFGGTIIKRLKGTADPSIEGGMPLVDVRDVARAHVRAMACARPAPAYLLVAETMPTKAWHDLISELSGAPVVERYISAKMALTMARLAEAAAKLSGQPPRFTRDTIQHVAINQQFDCSLAREELGLEFTPVAETLRDTIAWFGDNGKIDSSTN